MEIAIVYCAFNGTPLTRDAIDAVELLEVEKRDEHDVELTRFECVRVTC